VISTAVKVALTQVPSIIQHRYDQSVHAAPLDWIWVNDIDYGFAAATRSEIESPPSLA